MADTGVQIRCQRCGDAMEMVDPAPGQAWTPQQFWTCRRCGRHFWTTYVADPSKPAVKAPPPATPGATTPAPTAQAPAATTPTPSA
jgi:hypothetical protein